MTTTLMFFELVSAVCQPKINTRNTRNKIKLNCVKAIFILIGTALTLAQPIWCKSST